MAIAVPEWERGEVSEPVILRLKPLVELTDEQFFALCQMNDPYRMERTAEGSDDGCSSTALVLNP